MALAVILWFLLGPGLLITLLPNKRRLPVIVEFFVIVTSLPLVTLMNAAEGGLKAIEKMWGWPKREERPSSNGCRYHSS